MYPFQISFRRNITTYNFFLQKFQLFLKFIFRRKVSSNGARSCLNKTCEGNNSVFITSIFSQWIKQQQQLKNSLATASRSLNIGVVGRTLVT
jgi:hypothetical protein